MGKQVTGDDLIHFPTPTEAFGVRIQQQKPVRKPPSQQHQLNNRPPAHPQQQYQQLQQQHQYQQHQQRPVRQQNSTPVPQQRYANPQQLPLKPRQQLQQVHQQQFTQPIQQNRPSSKFSQERISSQSSFNDLGSPYSGYAPSAYSQLQQINNQPVQSQQQRMNSDPAEMLERQLRELFDRMDRDCDGGLRDDELSVALVNNDGTQFKSSTIRLMIRLFDKDSSGKIEFKEFFHLWNYILHWRKTFQRFDIDLNGKISFGEYQTALESFGYRIPTDIVLFIFQRFGDFNNSNKPMFLGFDMFVESLVWLLRCTNVFKKFDLQGNGIATISFQDFVHEILSFI